MKYFVSSDIHGFYDEWMQALKEKDFDIKNPEHKIILCGDIFDRGHQPKEIIDFILMHREKVILIRGNHEDLMEAMIQRNNIKAGDLVNGTAETIIDIYPHRVIKELNLSKIAKETGLQEVLDMCIDYFETSKYIFIHGWIPVIEEDAILYNANWRKASKQSWQRARWLNPVEMYINKIFEPNKTIVCGHWHCSAFWAEKYPDKYTEFGDSANFEAFMDSQVIALDACTVKTHKVNVLVVEDNAS